MPSNFNTILSLPFSPSEITGGAKPGPLAVSFKKVTNISQGSVAVATRVCVCGENSVADFITRLLVIW